MKKGSKHRSLIAPILQVVFTALIVGWILQRNDARAVYESFGRIDWTWLIVAISILVISLFAGTRQWDRLLRVQSVCLPFGRLLHANSLGMFLNFVLPSGVGGDVVRTLHVHKKGQGGAKSVAATLLDRFVGLFTLALLAFAASILLVLGNHNDFFEKIALFTGLSALLFCITAVFLFSHRMTNWLVSGARWLGEGRLLDTVTGLRKAFLEYRQVPLQVLEITGWSLLTQLLRILVHYCSARALAIHIDFAWFLLFVPVVSLVSILPISVGGWGWREGIQKTLFSWPGVMVGVSVEAAVPLALALALLTSFLGMLVPAAVSQLLSLRFLFQGRSSLSHDVALEKNP